MKGVMLDLETMSTQSHGAIIAIGAVSVDPEEGTFGGDSFHRIIKLETAMRDGGIVDGPTIIWWLGQSEAARAPYLNDQGIDIRDALDQFSAWSSSIAAKGVIEMWGNGSDFDNILLGNAYRRLGRWPPYTYNRNRCYRTIKSLHPDVEFVRHGIHHNALDDAMSQAEHLVRIFDKIRSRKP